MASITPCLLRVVAICDDELDCIEKYENVQGLLLVVGNTELNFAV